MSQVVFLNNQSIPYTLRLSRRSRRMRLSIYADGNFVVTAPAHTHPRFIENFIQEKSAWVLDKLGHLKTHKPTSFLPKATRRSYKKYKEQARVLAEYKVAEFNRHYGFIYNKITIRNQKSRWGSCSRKGNLNFNYKIALLPERLADYLVVHELCHLGEFNHSAKFWALVGQTVPDYKEMRKRLKGTVF